MPRITKFYTDIHIDLLYIHTGYDVNSGVLSEVIAKTPSKMPPPSASGGFSSELFERVSRNLTSLSAKETPHKGTEYNVTVTVVFVQLKNVIEYCIKVRITGASGQRVE